MYTPHEIRTAIRNCTTIAELKQLEFTLLPEYCNFSPTLIEVFNAGMLRQKFKINKHYSI